MTLVDPGFRLYFGQGIHFLDVLFLFSPLKRACCNTPSLLILSRLERHHYRMFESTTKENELAPPVGKTEGKAPWQPLPASFPLQLQAGENIIQLHSVEGCLHPVDYIPNSDDQRCISFAVQNVSLK